MDSHHKKALILGTGGASKAVAYALQQLKIEFNFVSRSGSGTIYSYDELTPEVMDRYQIIINTTPLGTFPTTDQWPPINYELLSARHIAFDLV